MTFPLFAVFVGINLLWKSTCHAQNENILRLVRPPYPLSFKVLEVNGSAVSYGPDDSTSPDKYYRTLALHDGQLFVGGKNELFSVSPEDLSLISNVTILADSAFQNVDCENCHNNVRIIQPLSAGLLLECGTNAFVPYCQPRTTQNLSTIGIRTDFTSGNILVPSVPDQNSSFLLLNDTGFQIYSGTHRTSTRFGGLSDPVIARTNPSSDVLSPLQSLNLTTKLDTKIFNAPEFVGDPVEYNGRIYFFFRETAVDYLNGYSQNIIYSRVAMICKDDAGGRPFLDFLETDFVTFTKARLNCSTSGRFPYYYNEVQDVYQSTTDGRVVFAVFATRSNEPASSAVCAYRLDEIESLFLSSSFRARNLDQELYREMPSPVTPRQSECPYTKSYDNDQYEGILGRGQLLFDSAANKLYYENSGTRLSSALLVATGERFTQIVVDENVRDSIDVMYIGTENGTVLKVYLTESRSQARIVEEISLNIQGKRPVLTMLKSSEEQAVFVGTDVGVFKIPFQHCQDYTTNQTCLDARDPYCRWDGICSTAAVGEQNLENGAGDASSISDEIVILVAPNNQQRALQVTDQPVNLHLVARAPVGSNLRSADDQITCSSPCSLGLSFDSNTCTSSGLEFLFLFINGTSSQEDSTVNNCTCSCNLITDNGATTTSTFILTQDNSTAVYVNSIQLDELEMFDDQILQYKQELDKWLISVGTACGVNNVQVCPATGCS